MTVTTTDPKLIEPVAWMYRWKDEPPVCMDSKRDWAVHNADWTETPLYTAAAINEAVQKERAGNYKSFTDGMEAAAQICGSLAETTYDDADAFEAAIGCEAAIMRVVMAQRREQAAIEAHKESQHGDA